jgi:hypothetical protein
MTPTEVGEKKQKIFENFAHFWINVSRDELVCLQGVRYHFASGAWA